MSVRRECCCGYNGWRHGEAIAKIPIELFQMLSPTPTIVMSVWPPPQSAFHAPQNERESDQEITPLYIYSAKLARYSWTCQARSPP